MARFQYLNVNDSGRKELDCVARAISYATETDYAFVHYLLVSNSLRNGCDMLTKFCYRQVLEGKFGLKPINGNGMSVAEVADKYPYNRVIMRLQGHLTNSAPISTVIDIFDCRGEMVDELWIVE